MPQSSPIQGFWSGPPLSALNRACLRSFVDRGHAFTLFSYDAIDVPAGVTVRDAADIVPRSELFHYRNDITREEDIAPFADYFRWTLLAEHGGWYCDVDTVCLSRDLPRGPRVWARQCPELDPDSVSNGQLHFAPGDPVARRLLERCRAERGSIERRESLGPVLISSVLTELGLSRDMNATADTFYPIRWIEIFKLWLPEYRDEVHERIERAIFLPVYQSFPKYLGLDPGKAPPDRSYLAEIVAAFAPDQAGEAYRAEEVRAATRRWFEAEGVWATEWLSSIRGPAVLSELGLRG
jgi:hypothetical protein